MRVVVGRDRGQYECQYLCIVSPIFNESIVKLAVMQGWGHPFPATLVSMAVATVARGAPAVHVIAMPVVAEIPVTATSKPFGSRADENAAGG